MLRSAASLLEGLLAADPGYRGPRVSCGQGHEAEFVSYRSKFADTVVGPVRLTRAWYHCAACKHGLAPRDIELGVAGASLSPGLAAMNDTAAAAAPFAKAAALLEDLAGITLTVKRVERAAEASGAAHAAAQRDRAALIAGRKLAPPPPEPLPDKLYAVIDGTGVPMTSAETYGRSGKGDDGRARTREVKLAVFFTQDKLDKDGYPVRGPKTLTATSPPSSPPARSPAWSRPRASAAAPATPASSPSSATAQPGSGTSPAPSSPRPPRSSISYHAREHLNDLAKLMEFMLGDQKAQWLAARMEDLDYGYIDGITAAARAYPLVGIKKNQLDTALGYFENNAPRMRYHWFRQCGLFVGSGVVEASCKSVIGQRLKLSGMHWSLTGADAITTLRCQQASRPQDRIWPAARNQTLAA